MKFFSATTALALCLVAITPAAAQKEFGRACDNFNLGGQCIALRAGGFNCVNLIFGPNDIFNDRISSIKVNAPFFCQFFTEDGSLNNTGCNLAQGVLAVNNLQTRNLNGSPFNNAISSYRCFDGV